jgi:hypothetical protein
VIVSGTGEAAEKRYCERIAARGEVEDATRFESDQQQFELAEDIAHLHKVRVLDEGDAVGGVGEVFGEQSGIPIPLRLRRVYQRKRAAPTWHISFARLLRFLEGL